jgi:carbon-monoxide dehydrogenase large subunit
MSSASRSGPIGEPIPRFEDPPLLRGTARFVGDLREPGMFHVAFLRSPVAHARITAVALEDALASESVVGAFAAEAVRSDCDPFRVHIDTPGVVAPERLLLADDKVRYIGEPVAVVVAQTRYVAEDAVERIRFEYELLPTVGDSRHALQHGAPLVHESVRDNVYFRAERAFGDVESAFAEADTIVEATVVHPRVAAAPIECRGVLARPAPGGGVAVWSSTQCPHIVAEAIGECCRLGDGLVRVLTPEVGGGFGVKAHVYPEEATVAWLALKLGRPVMWLEDRSEHLQGASHARDQQICFRAAVRSDGVVLGLDVRIVSNIGAYGIRPHGPLLDPMTTAGLVPGPYSIENYRYETIAVATNRSPEGPFRGVGMATAALTHERLMDLVAAKLALDPAEVRRRNFIPVERMPYTTVTGHPYESGDHRATLEIGLLAFDYAGALEQQAQARAAGRLVGIGIGSYVEFTGGGSATFVGRGMVGIPGVDTARLWLDDMGTVRVQSSSPAIGQGSKTTLAQVVAAAVGVDVDQVVVEQTDTAVVSRGTGTFMSRSSVGAATAAHRAGRSLRSAILTEASRVLGLPCDSLAISGNAVVSSSGGGPRLMLSEFVNRLPGDRRRRMNVEVTYDPPSAAHPLASHICLLEVDPDTGGVRVLRYVVSEDCGYRINPMLVDGQVHGGIAQGLAAVLSEEVVYDDDGQLLTGSFMDYLIPTAAEVPTVDIRHTETPTPVHDLGVKGVGEGGTIGATAAVANAVADAIGAASLELPLSPARIVEALASKHPTPEAATGLTRPSST